MTSFKVGYFVGSLASASINRLLAKALVQVAPSELQMTEIPFKDLPLYSYDYDTNYPPVATAFKDAIAAVDAVLFVTPEYNRSIPGALKNAIDWASRPYGKNAFTRKPSAVIGTSPGKIGTAVGQQHRTRRSRSSCAITWRNSTRSSGGSTPRCHEARSGRRGGLLNRKGSIWSGVTHTKVVRRVSMSVTALLRYQRRGRPALQLPAALAWPYHARSAP